MVRGLLGPSLVHEYGSSPSALRILAIAAAGLVPQVAPVATEHAVALPVAVEHGSLTAVLAPDPLDRGGRPLRLRAAPGEYRDLWTDDPVRPGPDGEIALPAAEGIALLWRPGRDETARSGPG